MSVGDNSELILCQLPRTGVAYSTLQLLSLRTDNDALVKKFQFKGKPILGIHSNRRVIAVVFKKRILVMDSASFGMRFYIKSECTTCTCIFDIIAY